MASRTRAAILLLMIVVAVALEVCGACDECSGIPTYKPPKGSAPSIGGGEGGGGGGGEGGGVPSFGGGGAPTYKPPQGSAPGFGEGGEGGGAPSYGGGGEGKGKRKKVYSCPVALAKLSVCSPLLGGVVGGLLPTSSGCCPLLGLLGVDVEVCLCLALDANILGLISIDAPLDVIVSILTSCGYKVPHKFACPHY